MKFGLSDQEYHLLDTALFLPLKQKNARIFVFGSRARGNHHPYSDVDILVQSDRDLSNFISQLIEDIEASNFPYKIDVVEERNLAESYQASITRDKICVA
jgi:predicted nucleotidyltransferase